MAAAACPNCGLPVRRPNHCDLCWWATCPCSAVVDLAHPDHWFIPDTRSSTC